MSQQNIDVKPKFCEQNVPLNTLLQLIPDFDTTQSGQVYKFIRSCDSAFKLASLEQEEILLIYALNKISGNTSSDIHAKLYSNWDDLKTFLIQKFSQTKTLSHLNLELQSLFQKPNESVTEFFHRVDLCRNKILEKLTTEVVDATLIGRKTTTEETALNVFINGLSSDIGVMLRTKGFDSLTHAGNFAIQEEKIRKMNTARQSLFKNSRITTPLYSNVVRQPPQINQPQIHKPPDKHTINTNPRKFIICNYCKKPGHHITNCRKRIFNNSRNNQFPRNNPTPARVNHLNLQPAELTGTVSETVPTYCPNISMITEGQDIALEPQINDLQIQ
ncbi:uncharacterized protein LOC128202073 [Galleria mellonella]|uniref:Uncharacterized protein LOC128200406 n=1 Tax=Galleria mellonella TaxID=7137 RepID=A0ABM3MEB0_GALME|nr:uncharacterized protein LOC128200406 [Galleria mellonella]XP_052755310.1 uncharacterized protein LOC128201673 [Galleria mellonella]XP_052757005.1 uncharacterized protein LOC128202073 [Galleria mellonella]